MRRWVVQCLRLSRTTRIWRLNSFNSKLIHSGFNRRGMSFSNWIEKSLNKRIVVYYLMLHLIFRERGTTPHLGLILLYLDYRGTMNSWRISSRTNIHLFSIGIRNNHNQHFNSTFKKPKYENNIYKNMSQYSCIQN